MNHGVLRYERDELNRIWAVHSTYRVMVETIPSAFTLQALDSIDNRLKAIERLLTSSLPQANNQDV